MPKALVRPHDLSVRDQQDITALLDKDFTRVAVVEYQTYVALEVTYGHGEVVLIPVASGCGCCGSPWIPSDEEVAP